MIALTDKVAQALLQRSATHIAASMVHGDYAERDRAYSTAHDMDREVGGFIALVKDRICHLGGDPWVWSQPVSPATDSDIPDAEILTEREARWQKEIGAVIARHITGAYVSGSDHQHARASELERDLIRAGLDLSVSVSRRVLEQMRLTPANRGEYGRGDNCPF